MKKIRDYYRPESWGCIYVPDDVAALLDLCGYKIDLYALLESRSIDVCVGHVAQGSLTDMDFCVFNCPTRGVAVRKLVEWVRSGMPKQVRK